MFSHVMVGSNDLERSRRELVAIVPLARLDLSCRVEPPRSVCDLGLDACDLDLRGRDRGGSRDRVSRPLGG